MKKIISIIIIIVLSLNMCISAFGDEPMTVVTVVSGGGGDINYVNKDEKGNDLILYFLDDNTHADLMDFLHNHAMVHVPVGNSSILTMTVPADDYFTWRIDDKHVAFKNIARLVDVLPEVLADGRTFEEYYNSLSTRSVSPGFRASSIRLTLG